MTDKKIIDGIAVSECKFYCEEYCNLSNDRNERLPFAEKCTGYSDCYYKQLKRKEQECEELKKANDGILTTIRILAKNNIKLREILAEIQEIASYLFNMSTSQCMATLALILSKISEV